MGTASVDSRTCEESLRAPGREEGRGNGRGTAILYSAVCVCVCTRVCVCVCVCVCVRVHTVNSDRANSGSSVRKALQHGPSCHHSSPLLPGLVQTHTHAHTASHSDSFLPLQFLGCDGLLLVFL